MRCQRVVAAAPEDAKAALDRWLQEQLFEPIRDRDGIVLYEPRHDTAARQQRDHDRAGRLRLTAVARLAVTIGSGPGAGSGAVVRVEAEPASSRLERAVGPWAAAVPVIVFAAVAVVAATPIGIDAFLAVLAAFGVLGAAWGWWWAVRHEHAELDAACEAVEGALDRLG